MHSAPDRSACGCELPLTFDRDGTSAPALNGCAAGFGFDDLDIGWKNFQSLALSPLTGVETT